jgi:hypothetical protein
VNESSNRRSLAVTTLLSGTADAVQAAEDAIAKYEKENQSSILQNAARAAAEEARSTLDPGARSGVSTTNGSSSNVPARIPTTALRLVVRAAEAALKRAALMSGGVESQQAPLDALGKLRSQLQIEMNKRKATSAADASVEPAYPPLPVICSHVALPTLVRRPRSKAGGVPGPVVRSQLLSSSFSWDAQIEVPP